MRMERCGGDVEIPFESRIISGSSFSANSILEKGMIRADLFHRLNVIELKIPALTMRKEDIVDLVSHFLDTFHKNEKLPNRTISDSAIIELRNIKWIGNVRQLRNLIERILILGAKSGEITKEEIIKNDKDLGSQESVLDIDLENLLSMNLKNARGVFERYYLAKQVQSFDGNISKTAKFIGMERSALHRKLKDLKT